VSWESVSVALACGCPGTGSYDTTDPGDEQACGQHGQQRVKRVSRIRESRGSRDFSLGTGVEA
jgi:hypothetical protein